MLLLKYFIDVVKIYSHLTLKKDIIFNNMDGPHLINCKALRAKLRFL